MTEEKKEEVKEEKEEKKEEKKESTTTTSSTKSVSATPKSTPEATGSTTTPPPATEEEVEVPKKFKKLVEEIEKMSVLDLAELVKILEKKFGVSAAAPMAAVAAVPASAEASADKEEKSVFNIELKEVGEKKIEVIKVARDVMEKGLKEAKDLVDAAANESQTVKENVKKEEAEEIKKKFEAAGAKVELK